ncbi:MAG: DUF2304 domain-containing protein [Ignavibacteria bacterium]|jgi:hypothetical protein
MFENYLLFGLFFSVILFIVNVYLFRFKKISGPMFIQWFIISILIGVVSIVPIFIQIISNILGTQLTMSGITGVLFLFLFSFIYYLQYRLNKLENKLHKLLPIVLSKMDNDVILDKNEEE